MERAPLHGNYYGMHMCAGAGSGVGKRDRGSGRRDGMKAAVVAFWPLGVVLPFRFEGVGIQHGGLKCQEEHSRALPCFQFGIAKEIFQISFEGTYI